MRPVAAERWWGGYTVGLTHGAAGWCYQLRRDLLVGDAFRPSAWREGGGPFASEEAAFAAAVHQIIALERERARGPTTAPAQAARPATAGDPEGPRDPPRRAPAAWCARCGDCGRVMRAATRAAAAARLAQHLRLAGHHAWTLLPASPWPGRRAPNAAGAPRHPATPET